MGKAHVHLLLYREGLTSGGRMAWLGHTALWQPRAKRRPTEREGRVRGQGGNERMGGRVKGQNQETEMSNYIQNSKKQTFILCLGNYRIGIENSEYNTILRSGEEKERNW